MKKLYSLCTLMASVYFLQAQIVVTASDFADPGNKVVMSTAVNPLFFDYQSTGEDTTWDYSFLQYNDQHIDTFLNEYQAPAFYILYFSNTSLNPHRANIARRNTTNAPLSQLLPITTSNRFDYYYKNNSSYVQQGFGASVNNIPTPVPFSNKDVLYRFPMQYGDRDTSESGYSINLPTVAYYGYDQTRTNYVDGWGTLISPFGTFQVLREVTEISSQDSVYINSFNFGLKIPHFSTHEYKWITNGQKEPVLQINTQILVANVELISEILYRDTLHPVINGINDVGNADLQFKVFPNPANSSFEIALPEGSNESMIKISAISGQVLYSSQSTQKTESINCAGWVKGIYFIEITTGSQRAVQKLVIQ